MESHKNEQKEIREQLKWIARISNSHRGALATKALNDFEKGIDEAKFSPLIIPFIKRFIQLATEGSNKQLRKKKPTTKSYSKIHLDDVKTESAGMYTGKYGIHINPGQTPKEMISTFLHEMTHHLLMDMNNGKGAAPTPLGPWMKLGSSIDEEFRQTDEHGSSYVPDELNFLVYNEEDVYDTDNWPAELPARLMEFIFLKGRLPSEEDGFTSVTVQMIQELFTKLIEKIPLNKTEEKSIENPIYIYQQLITVNDTSAIQALLKSLPDFGTLRNMGIFPLHIAASQGNIGLLTELLKKSGANINEPDKLYNSPLHVALRCGKTDIVKMLIANGADTNIQNIEDRATPLLLAWHCNKDALPLLLDKKIDIDQNQEFLMAVVGRTLAEQLPELIYEQLNGDGAPPLTPPITEQEKKESPNLKLLTGLFELGFQFPIQLKKEQLQMITAENPSFAELLIKHTYVKEQTQFNETEFKSTRNCVRKIMINLLKIEEPASKTLFKEGPASDLIKAKNLYNQTFSQYGKLSSPEEQGPLIYNLYKDLKKILYTGYENSSDPLGMKLKECFTNAVKDDPVLAKKIKLK